MKIAFLSTYPPLKCGIAYYTRNLTKALLEEGEFNISILSRGNGIRVSDNVDVIKSWQMGKTSSFLKVIYNINTIKPDLIHIQFHPGLYGSPCFSTIFILSLLIYLKIFPQKTVITFHTLPMINKLKSWYGYRILVKNIIRLFIRMSNSVIVHTEGQRVLLRDVYNIVKNINIIPIGVDTINGQRKEGLEEFIIQNGLDNKFIILSCPHLRFGLDLEYVIEAVNKFSGKDIVFIINGLSPAVIDKERRYLNYLLELREKLGLGDKVRFVTDSQLWEETRLLWCQAAKLIVYSHSDYPSEDASMSLGEAVGLFKPLMVFDVPKFRDIAITFRNNGLGDLVVPNINPEDKIMYIYNSMCKVKDNYFYYRDTIDMVLKYFIEKRTWRQSAFKLNDVYKELL